MRKRLGDDVSISLEMSSVWFCSDTFSSTLSLHFVSHGENEGFGYPIRIMIAQTMSPMRVATKSNAMFRFHHIVDSQHVGV